MPRDDAATQGSGSRLSLTVSRYRALWRSWSRCSPGSIVVRRPPAEAIEFLLTTQIGLCNSRCLEAAVRSIRLPVVSRLDNFDFSIRASAQREQIDSLYGLEFVERRGTSSSWARPGSATRNWRSAWQSRRPRTGAGSTSEPWPTCGRCGGGQGGRLNRHLQMHTPWYLWSLRRSDASRSRSAVWASSSSPSTGATGAPRRNRRRTRAPRKGAGSSAMRLWPPLSWTGCSIGAASSTSPTIVPGVSAGGALEGDPSGWGPNK